SALCARESRHNRSPANNVPGSREFRRSIPMHRIMQFASAPIRVLIVIPAIWGAAWWLTGYLRPLDAALGTELPVGVVVPGIAAAVLGSALVLWCGVMLCTRGIGTLQ